MHRIGKLHLEISFSGSRMLQQLLIQEGLKAEPLDFATLMKRLGTEALYLEPITSKPPSRHKPRARGM